MQLDWKEIKNILDGLQTSMEFSSFGYAPLKQALTFPTYKKWIDHKKHAGMDYLERHLSIKENPPLHFEKMHSVLVFSFPYLPHPEKTNLPVEKNRIARYAQGRDYHHWLKEKLSFIAEKLTLNNPHILLSLHTDSSPLMERDLAHQAGLGWIGKNSCLIHPKKGSFSLLGEILLNAEIINFPKVEIPDFCGKCDKCIKACPTQAIQNDRTLDAQKCISYLTIESRSVPDVPLRSQIGDWLFGCDICQTVCPWNHKIFQFAAEENAPLRLQNSNENADESSFKDVEKELEWILTSSGKTLEKRFQNTALSRAGGFGLKRNALIVAGNLKLKSLVPAIEVYVTHDRLGELANWCLLEFKK